jgi:multisubunit Na+/H+ antiporter MnhE subunit
MRRSVAFLMLILRFGRAVVVSGVETIAVILKTGRPGAASPPVALVRVRFAPLSARGAALLGSMVSLTPGTTTIDIDMERYELLLHVLRLFFGEEGTA